MSAAVSTLSDIIKRNDAVNVNPPNPIIDLHITEHGSDWLWAVFQFCIICNCAWIHLQFY